MPSASIAPTGSPAARRSCPFRKCRSASTARELSLSGAAGRRLGARLSQAGEGGPQVLGLDAAVGPIDAGADASGEVVQVRRDRGKRPDQLAVRALDVGIARFGLDAEELEVVLALDALPQRLEPARDVVDGRRGRRGLRVGSRDRRSRLDVQRVRQLEDRRFVELHGAQEHEPVEQARIELRGGDLFRERALASQRGQLRALLRGRFGELERAVEIRPGEGAGRAAVPRARPAPLSPGWRCARPRAVRRSDPSRAPGSRPRRCVRCGRNSYAARVPAKQIEERLPGLLLRHLLGLARGQRFHRLERRARIAQAAELMLERDLVLLLLDPAGAKDVLLEGLPGLRRAHDDRRAVAELHRASGRALPQVQRAGRADLVKTSKELGDRTRGEIARLRRFRRLCLAGALRGGRSLLRELEDGRQHLRLEHRLAEEVPHAQLERAPVELGRALAARHHHDRDVGCIRSGDDTARSARSHRRPRAGPRSGRSRAAPGAAGGRPRSDRGGARARSRPTPARPTFSAEAPARRRCTGPYCPRIPFRRVRS